MSTIELKEILLKKIESAEDSLLKDMLALIEFESSDEVYVTTEAEKVAISKGLSQIEKGETFTNDEVVKEINQWLKE